MFSNYVAAAMRHATYEIIDDPEPYYGHIPELQGVWATGATLAACQEELQSSLEDWLVLGIALHHDIPPIDGLTVTYSLSAAD